MNTNSNREKVKTKNKMTYQELKAISKSKDNKQQRRKTRYNWENMDTI